MKEFKFNGCWKEWGFKFDTLLPKIAKLPFVDKTKLNKLYKDIESKCCYYHDLDYFHWGWVKDFIKSNYVFSYRLICLLHWTSMFWRITIFSIAFMWLNIFWISAFNWGKKIWPMG